MIIRKINILTTYTMKKAALFIIVALLGITPCLAQNFQYDQRPPHDQRERRDGRPDFKRFNPEEYQRKLEAHITKFAGLTTQEAQKFFPLFREMQQKQRAIFMKQKKRDMSMFSDNKAAFEAINHHDEAEIQIKKLQQYYHRRFTKVLPASKVLKCIVAEDVFNRKMMRGFAGR